MSSNRPSLPVLYFRTIIILIILAFTGPSSFSQSSFIPNQLNGCILWLSTDSFDTLVGSRILTWNDNSGMNHSISQTDTNKAPILVFNPTMNARFIRFDGIDDYLDGNINFNGNELSTFVVMKCFSYGTYLGALTLYNAAEANDYDTPNALIVAMYMGSNLGLSAFRAGGNYNYQANTYLDYTTSAIIWKNNILTTYTNGIQAFTAGSGGNMNADKVIAGCRHELGTQYHFSTSEIAEIIIYNQALNDSSRTLVNNYLKHKYGQPEVRFPSDTIIQYGFCPVELKVDSIYKNYLWSNGSNTYKSTLYNPGKYWVRTTDIWGNVSSDTVLLIYPAPILKDTSLCIGDTLHVHVDLGDHYTYLWSSALSDSITSNNNLDISIPGKYWITVKDTLGCSVSDTLNILTDPFSFVSAFAADTAHLCFGDTLFPAVTGFEIINYSWGTGSSNPFLLATNNGIQTLQVTDNFGCSIRDTIYTHIKGLPPAADFIHDDSLCLGSFFQFHDISTTQPGDTTSIINTWYWKFDDTTNSHLQNPVVQFYNPLLHHVSLLVTSNQGCKNQVDKSVFVLPLPRANFAANAGCAGVPVPFYDISASPVETITQRHWNFGDPSSGTANQSTDSISTHQYNIPGNYPVTLEVTSLKGCRDTLIKTIQIFPSPDIGFNVEGKCLNQPLLFEDTTQVSPWNPVMKRIWNFGDGTSDSVISPVHQYSTPGIYPVTLQIKTLQCNNTFTRNIPVKANPNADFNAEDICAQTLYHFTNLSLAPDDSIIYRKWTFDTLGISYAQNPDLWFNSPGQFSIGLTVMTSSNCFASRQHQIRIFPKPSANFNFALDTSKPFATFQFENLSQGGQNYLWSFGDGQTSGSWEPFHQYSSPGNYNVSLVVSNSFLCTDTVSNILQVLSPLFDLSLQSVIPVFQPDKLEITMDIFNNSPLVVDTLSVGVEMLRKEEKFRFELGTHILPYQHMVKTVSLPVNNLIPGSSAYICVTATSFAFPDTYPENNKFCLSLTNKPYVIGPYPNPAQNHLQFDIYSESSTSLSYQISDSQGRTITNPVKKYLVNGLNSLSIPISDLAPGVYFINFTGDFSMDNKLFFKY